MRKFRINITSSTDAPATVSIYLGDYKLEDRMRIQSKFPKFETFEYQCTPTDHVIKIELHRDETAIVGRSDLIIGGCQLADQSGNYPLFDYLLFPEGNQNLLYGNDNNIVSMILRDGETKELSFNAQSPSLWHDYNAQNKYEAKLNDELFALFLERDIEFNQ